MQITPKKTQRQPAEPQSNHSIIEPLGQIRRDPVVQRILQRMPEEVADSFTEKQLTHLKIVIGARSWGSHKIDLRGTIALPFRPWRYYYVLLWGKNRRSLSHTERNISAFTAAMMLSLFFIGCSLLGLLVLYLAKSAAGIDLLPGFSLGIWDWFKTTFGVG